MEWLREAEIEKNLGLEDGSIGNLYLLGAYQDKGRRGRAKVRKLLRKAGVFRHVEKGNNTSSEWIAFAGEGAKLKPVWDARDAKHVFKQSQPAREIVAPEALSPGSLSGPVLREICEGVPVGTEGSDAIVQQR